MLLSCVCLRAGEEFWEIKMKIRLSQTGFFFFRWKIIMEISDVSLYLSVVLLLRHCTR